jgi:hypothetical protein
MVEEIVEADKRSKTLNLLRTGIYVRKYAMLLTTHKLFSSPSPTNRVNLLASLKSHTPIEISFQLMIRLA